MTENEKVWQREYNRKRRADPEYRARQKAYAANWQARTVLTPEQKARKAERARLYARDESLRLKHEARWQAQRAIVSGKLVRQPCEVCGAVKVHAHHDDYSKPLAIRWLCQKHHREHHAKAGAL